MSTAGSHPDDPCWAGLRLPVRTRLAAAVAQLHAINALRRSDIQQLGEVSVPQASADINEIKKRLPGRLAYDATAKCYRLAGDNGDASYSFTGHVADCDYALRFSRRPSVDELHEVQRQLLEMFKSYMETEKAI